MSPFPERDPNPPEVYAGDSRCTHCGCNVDDPRTPAQQPCDRTVNDPDVICASCCAWSESPCDDCIYVTTRSIPARPNYSPTNTVEWTATGRAGTPNTNTVYQVVEIDLCNDCTKPFTTDTLTRIAVHGGTILACWPCVEKRRDMGLSA